MKKIIIKPSQLKLSFDNPRFSSIIKRENESAGEMMLRVVSLTKMKNLLSNMLETNQLDPLSNIGVYEKDDSYYLLDGNRRGFSILIIFGLVKIPEGLKTLLVEQKDRVSLFVEKYKELEVTLFNTKAEAEASIRAIHVHSGDGVSTLKWDSFSTECMAKKPMALFLN